MYVVLEIKCYLKYDTKGEGEGKRQQPWGLLQHTTMTMTKNNTVIENHNQSWIHDSKVFISTIES